LIQANGDVGRAFGTTESAFLDDWRRFVRALFQMASGDAALVAR